MAMGRAGTRVVRIATVHSDTDTPLAIGSLISIMLLAYGLRASNRDDRARPEPRRSSHRFASPRRPVTA